MADRRGPTVTTVIVATLTGPFVGTLVLPVSGASFGFVNIGSALFGAPCCFRGPLSSWRSCTAA